jgi:hypothetical protein
MNKLIRPTAEFIGGLGTVSASLVAAVSLAKEIVVNGPEDTYSYTKDWLIVGGVALLGTVLLGDSIETTLTRLERPTARQ